MGFAGAQPILQRQVPVLAHHDLTEAAPPLAGRELKSCALVDVPCRGEHFVGPQGDPLIFGGRKGGRTEWGRATFKLMSR